MRKVLTRLEKKLIIAQAIQKAVVAIFNTHTYWFANTFFLYRRGGPIGLHSTSCIDVRVWLHCVMLGWRWRWIWYGGELIYRSTWRTEEAGRDDLIG